MAILFMTAAVVGVAWFLFKRRSPVSECLDGVRDSRGARSLVLGFTPVEVLVIVAAIAAAVIAGLLLGGALTY